MQIDWVNFTPAAATIGGALIGLAAVLLMAFNGRIMGMMPHPERAADPELGASDGLTFLTNALQGVASA